MTRDERYDLSSLGRLVHELEAPLLVIETELAVLEKDAVCRPRAERCLSEVRALRELVASLVPLAIPRGELETTRFDLVPVVERLSRRIAGQVESRGVRLRCDVPTPFPATGNAAATERILSNLLDNAVKFTSPGGTVELQAFTTGEGRPAVAVSDDGPGLSDDERERERVFEPFYRANPEAPGFGMGLAIARHYAEQQGGSLSAAASESLGGARFVLVLDP